MRKKKCPNSPVKRAPHRGKAPQCARGQGCRNDCEGREEVSLKWGRQFWRQIGRHVPKRRACGGSGRVSGGWACFCVFLRDPIRLDALCIRLSLLSTEIVHKQVQTFYCALYYGSLMHWSHFQGELWPNWPHQFYHTDWKMFVSCWILNPLCLVLYNH